ncbi:sensor histidine kinase [Paenibacillus daejeonensis]|uniref:sensor histidine kinase n=1 Tax=Paenibacillus daejeonensis TaxID=135193 RepID=UPI00037364A4|nr:HAMP domain-containing sensor histidine kinase [Paenibacillus daejeonensis]
MDRNAVFRKQKLQFTVLNFITFTLIFALFAIIILGQVQRSMYTQTDAELRSFKERAAELANRTPGEDMPGMGGGGSGPRSGEGPYGIPFRPDSGTVPPNPRLTVLLWDESGQIINQDQLGTTFYDTYFSDLSYNTAAVNEIRTITIQDSFRYRTLIYEHPDAENNVYATQLLINVDAEERSVASFQRILIICTVIFILLSIVTSLLLSSRTMLPIQRSWSRQTEFVENASHELRTPLTIIQNKLELLLTSPQERIVDRFEPIAVSLSETRRLSKLTTDLLTLARADSAETVLEVQEVQLDQFLKELSEPYAEIAELQDKQLLTTLEQELVMMADPERLHQLMVILLDNALKYTSEGDTIGILARREEQRIIIEVSDTGVGIRQENLQAVFDRFFREDKARSRSDEHGGAGLGLSIARWIVSAHQGTIEAIPQAEQGTVFRIRLPLR